MTKTEMLLYAAGGQAAELTKIAVSEGISGGGYISTEPAGTVVRVLMKVTGMGATVIGKVTIGEAALIGAGAVVVNDIKLFSVAVGNPASVIKKREFTGKYLP